MEEILAHLERQSQSPHRQIASSRPLSAFPTGFRSPSRRDADRDRTGQSHVLVPVLAPLNWRDIRDKRDIVPVAPVLEASRRKRRCRSQSSTAERNRFIISAPITLARTAKALALCGPKSFSGNLSGDSATCGHRFSREAWSQIAISPPPLKATRRRGDQYLSQNVRSRHDGAGELDRRECLVGSHCPERALTATLSGTAGDILRGRHAIRRDHLRQRRIQRAPVGPPLVPDHAGDEPRDLAMNRSEKCSGSSPAHAVSRRSLLGRMAAEGF
jgi:hypothetical protein